ncbi:MAG: glycosyltransferase family 4 protein [Bacteroidota bacterium]|nr:glycosyltransferase family 4 protein [Bacteroidota bacterium]
MKKVLIITYYWPPMGGGGVQRWLKTTKYLREFDWEPIIFTTENAEVSIHDESLLEDIPDGIEIIKVPIWEPFRLYRSLTGQKGEKINPGFLQKKKGNSFLQNISIWIRGNFFIPDAKKFWYRPSVKKLSSYLLKNKVDAIVSTGPPHTTHLIAQKIANRFNIPWLADFRDPWTNIDFYDKLKLTMWADKKHRRLERNVLKNASKIITVSKSWANDLLNISGINPIVINNGFDSTDFKNAGKLPLDVKFSITHAGSLNKDRNPFILWKVLEELVKVNSDFASKLEIKLIGPIDITVKEALKKHNLMQYTRLIDSLPHKEVIPHLITSQVLLLPLNNVPNIEGIIPGKMYEYLGALRPIICIGDIDGDAAEIIYETQTGSVVGFSDKNKLKKEVLKLYDDYKLGVLEINSNHYNKYSRKQLAERFAIIFNQML